MPTARTWGRPRLQAPLSAVTSGQGGGQEVDQVIRALQLLGTKDVKQVLASYNQSGLSAIGFRAEPRYLRSHWGQATAWAREIFVDWMCLKRLERLSKNNPRAAPVPVHDDLR